MDPHRKVTYKKGHHLVYAARQQHPLSVHVWGGISSRGAMSIVIFTGILIATRYTRILEAALAPFLTMYYPDKHRCSAQTGNLRKPRIALRKSGIPGLPGKPGIAPIDRSCRRSEKQRCGRCGHSSGASSWACSTGATELKTPEASSQRWMRRRNGTKEISRSFVMKIFCTKWLRVVRQLEETKERGL